MKRHRDPVWQAKVEHTRKEALRVVNDIRRGFVNEHDMDMLHNFVQFALALMQAEGPKKWELAKLNAELMALMREPIAESVDEHGPTSGSSDGVGATAP
jgi:hypothetical protein